MKRAFDIGSVIALVALIAFGIFAAAGGLGEDNTSAQDSAREASCLAGSEDCDDTGGDAGGALGVCAPGVTDCVDTVVGGDNPAYTCIEGATDCNDTPVDGGATAPMCVEGTDCKDTIVGGAGQSCPADQPGCGVDGGAGSPGSVEPASPCEPEFCERNAVDAAWALLEEDGVDGEITLVATSPAEWPNACLGVDQPNVACAEVITPGFLVILARNSQEYTFHTDLNGNAVSAAD
jgi:hypothetical protein